MSAAAIAAAVGYGCPPALIALLGVIWANAGMRRIRGRALAARGVLLSGLALWGASALFTLVAGRGRGLTLVALLALVIGAVVWLVSLADRQRHEVDRSGIVTERASHLTGEHWTTRNAITQHWRPLLIGAVIGVAVTICIDSVVTQTANLVMPRDHKADIRREKIACIDAARGLPVDLARTRVALCAESIKSGTDRVLEELWPLPSPWQRVRQWWSAEREPETAPGASSGIDFDALDKEATDSGAKKKFSIDFDALDKGTEAAPRRKTVDEILKETEPPKDDAARRGR